VQAIINRLPRQFGIQRVIAGQLGGNKECIAHLVWISPVGQHYRYSLSIDGLMVMLNNPMTRELEDTALQSL
jgi:hypothetical protein